MNGDRVSKGADPVESPMSDEKWQKLKTRNPQLVQAIQANLVAVAAGELGWAELLQVSDDSMLTMARKAAAFIGQGRFAKAEQAFWVLTQLDPFVPTFWLSLGDARKRQGKLQEAIEAYGRCIEEGLAVEPPFEEVRTASFRRGALYARARNDAGAFEDLVRVVKMDTDRVFDGERAYLALQKLEEEGRISKEQFQTVPQPK